VTIDANASTLTSQTSFLGYSNASHARLNQSLPRSNSIKPNMALNGTAQYNVSDDNGHCLEVGDTDSVLDSLSLVSTSQVLV
jgi:hypothetical protein